MSASSNEITWGSDFTGIYDSVVWGATNLVSGDTWGNGIGFASVNEGSFASTIDEPNGVLAITTDTGDNDNAVLIGARCQPSLGPCWLEARFKYNNLDNAIFVGFTETLALDSPVMPAEFATATMTYNGTGGMVGFNYDVDGTTDDFRAVMGDGGAATASSGNGTRANATLTVDKYFIARVELHPDGSATCLLADSGHVDGNSRPILRQIKRFTAGVTSTDLFYPVLMIENRSGNARVLEVDYFKGGSMRSWTA